MGPLAVGGMSESVDERPLGRKLTAWWVLVGTLILVAFWASASQDDDGNTLDAVYTYEFGIGGLVLYGLLAVIVMVIALGLDRRETFALRRPNSWKTAGLLTLGILVAVFVVGGILEAIFHAGEEQGLDPTGWRSDRAAAFVLSALAIGVVGPIVEELMYRGLGYFLLSQFGHWAAIVITGLTFALAHGILAGIPVFFVIGAGLAYLRYRTNSIVPPILVHVTFNSLQLLVGVAG
ncbi:MAG: CPBP family intramembrane metalloprotease [Actinomycetota bacterium]|nr:CPBP family intramembrane metalloprotease [Actinomycetota bacterium]